MQQQRNPGGLEPGAPPRLRLLADDLTGALDSAAQFVPLVGRVPTFWHATMAGDPPPTAAFDSATRELDRAAAAERVGALAPLLVGADIAFKKIDSLLRGATAAEIAACLRADGFRSCVLAPAFPAQGRVTRGGRQLVRWNGAWRDVGVDLRAALAGLGSAVRLARPGDPPWPGVTLWDAETDADLGRVAEAGRQLGGSVLWCGAGGLAGALAGHARSPRPRLGAPLLGLFGSDHEVTRAQLRACDPHWLLLPPDDAATAASLVGSRLKSARLALAGFDLPSGCSRPEAARRISAGLAGLVAAIPRPRTLVVAGGETLRAVCAALGATSLEVTGQMLPGVPVSLLHGGRWDGVTVVSKSGAFGDAGLLRRLLALDAGEVGEGEAL